jgi:hypothetical protein
VKNQKENEPKELVIPDKEEAQSSFVMKKYETELRQDYVKKKERRSTKQRYL